jgi:phosphoglucosamine mutase
VTALQVLAAMVRSGKVLSELAACMPRYPQVLQNVRVRRREDLTALPVVQAEIQSVETALAGNGRVLVRFSGTEPLARVMIEGPDEARIRVLADRIASAIQGALG